MSNSVLRVIDIAKSFGKKKILEHIDLEIVSGEICGIIGPSGSGKTTLLNTMIGFLQPDKGDILFKIEHLLGFEDDNKQFKSVFTNQKEAKSIFGFAAQRPSIYHKMSCTENLKYFGSLYDLPRTVLNTNIEILLRLMGLYESRHIPSRHLSGGMQKRLDIACALIHDPKVLILDEPTSDLDPLLRKQMWKLLNEINSKGTTVILSSHFLDELEHFCNRVCILHDTRIRADGTPSEIKRTYSKEKRIRLETESKDYDKITAILESKEVSSYSTEKGKLIITTSSSEEILGNILSMHSKKEIRILDLSIEEPTLEQVLETMVGEAKNG